MFMFTEYFIRGIHITCNYKINYVMHVVKHVHGRNLSGKHYTHMVITQQKIRSTQVRHLNRYLHFGEVKLHVALMYSNKLYAAIWYTLIQCIREFI